MEKKGKVLVQVGALAVLALVLFLLAKQGKTGGSTAEAEGGSADQNTKMDGYEVLLPKEYETSNRNYPVVYVLPQDGYAVDGSGIAEKLAGQMDAILVKPMFGEGADIHTVMETLVQEVDASYRTVADKKYRAVVGTGTGGYLAYILGLTDGKDSVKKESGLFASLVSIRGDFVSGENPWYAAYGDVSSYIEEMHKKNETVFDGFYTYLDAPVEDAWTNLKGSSNDIGAQFIGFGTQSAAHEFTVRTGEFTDEFLDESIKRVGNRLMGYMMAGIADGTVKLEKATLTEDEKTAKAIYTVNLSEALAAFGAETVEAELTVSVSDPATGEVLAETTHTETVQGAGSCTGELEIENLVNGSASDVRLSVRLFAADLELAKTNLLRSQEPVIEGSYQKIDLNGDWYFNYKGTKETIDLTALAAEEYKTWSVVQPGLGNWEKGYGNISDENVSSPMGEDYFGYMIVGSGYYVKEFEIPEEFANTDRILSIGYVDDRCEVFVNGTRVGATGMDENGKPTGDTTWAQYSVFELPSGILNCGGTNTVAVRAWNDEPYGAGGWYDGPIGLYSREAFEELSGGNAGGSSRFLEETFASSYAASALGQQDTVENEYLVYLPKDYEETERYYPTVYLLHQFNSDHTSYKTDRIDQVLDRAIEDGLFDEMIVVVPNSEENSWWAGDWERMITEELIPLIDGKYRTIRDARYRLTAGCSMGGQGAFGVALRNPDYFTGAVSFFGAFSYGEENSPNHIASQESAEYMDYYTLYFICGNQDSYGFGAPAIELNQMLSGKGIAHGFFIENGGHDSGFYVPYFDDAFSYVRKHMYQSEDAVEGLVSGTLNIAMEDGVHVTAEFEALDGIEAYFHTIPESSYTKNANPDLSVPLIVQVVQDGEIVYEQTENDVAVNAENRTAAFTYDITEYVDTSKVFSVVYKAAVFDRIVTLQEVSMDYSEAAAD